MSPVDQNRDSVSSLHGRRAAVWGLVGALALLAGCSSTPEPPEPRPVRLLLSAADTLNPDMNGRPSPAVVRLFRLKEGKLFNAMDFFTLTDPDLKSLGEDLLFQELLVMHPGESTQREYALEPEAGALAIVVGYRDIDVSTWRASVLTPTPEASWFELPEFMRWGSDPAQEYTARLEQLAVSLEPVVKP
ncbi:MAG: type VI secretion system lipoprotein TssJ [Pseudomonas sp.]|uniref:type VI secretion system lipoprotein TssJ n=1 Tax=Pseudomonas sp. TaxID=306 RepID=UPI003396661A